LILIPNAGHFAFIQPDPRGPIRVAVAGFFSDVHPRGHMYSLQIAREMVPNERTMHRQIDELRLAQHIQRRFDQQQVLTIYMNRVNFGQNGAEDTSMRYFGKHASDLSLDEAALIAANPLTQSRLTSRASRACCAKMQLGHRPNDRPRLSITRGCGAGQSSAADCQAHGQL
jgi:penicillin-binding protein 1A